MGLRLYISVGHGVTAAGEQDGSPKASVNNPIAKARAFFPIPNISSFLVGWVVEPCLPLRAKPV